LLFTVSVLAPNWYLTRLVQLYAHVFVCQVRSWSWGGVCS